MRAELNITPVSEIAERYAELEVPPVIKKRLVELDKLVERYPKTIPVSFAAMYLGIDDESLRKALETGNTMFGMSWGSSNIRGSRRGFVISTLPFYFSQRRDILSSFRCNGR